MFKRLALLFAGILLAGAGCAQPVEPTAAATTWEAGKNYFVIEPAQPTASGDKVEVVEVFSYACVHCAHFQPYAEQIKRALPAYATFSYMPAQFNEVWAAYARAFYTAQTLGVLEQTHQALFDAIHRDQRPIRSMDDIAAFYAEHGVPKDKFMQTANSMVVESQLANAARMVPAYGVDGTPTIIVNGKYRLTGASAGGYPKVIELVEWLVKKEHDAAAKPAAKKK